MTYLRMLTLKIYNMEGSFNNSPRMKVNKLKPNPQKHQRKTNQPKCKIKKVQKSQEY